MKEIKMTINVPEDLYKMIKAQSAFNGSTIKDYVVRTISSSMKNQKDKIEKKTLRKKIPNKTTLKAIKEYELGKFTSYKSSEELFAKLDEIVKRNT
jgi:hypothetical protein